MNNVININLPYVTNVTCDASISHQDITTYTYYNLIRIAAIMDKLRNKSNDNRCVDDIFKTYLKFTERETTDTYVEKFEDIVLLYLNAKFPNITDIVAKNTVDLIVDHFPAYMWISEKVPFLAYNKVMLKSIVDKYMAFLLIGSTTLIPNTNIYYVKSEEELNNDFIITTSKCIQEVFKKKIDNPMVKCDKSIDLLFSSSKIATTPNSRLSVNVSSKHEDVKKIWVEENENKLLLLFLFTDILEICIQPMIEEYMKTPVDVPKIRIAFPLKKNNNIFTFTKPTWEC